VYDAVTDELSSGRQGDAEDLLEVFVGIHTNDQRLAFAQAVCTRSRFSKLKAGWQFRRVLDMDPRTVEGKCARYMLDLDDRREVERSFKGLHFLAEENPNNPLLHWMIGVQCRDHYRHAHRTERSAEGAAAYKLVLELFDVGPVLVHQTYANMLSEELQRHEEALKHRRIAVKLETKPWTLQGLANTLKFLGEFEEANRTYATLIELEPNDAKNWSCWADSFRAEQKWDECIARCKKALEIDPGYYAARNKWGIALEKQGKFREALLQFEETIQVHPVDRYAYSAAARVLRKLGEDDKADEFIERKAQIHGKHRADNPTSRIVVSAALTQGYEPTTDLNTVSLSDGHIHVYVKFMNVPKTPSKYDIHIYNQDNGLIHTRNREFKTANGIWKTKTSYKFTDGVDDVGNWRIVSVLNGVVLDERSIAVTTDTPLGQGDA
jgi:tetratricopeptide (TPR) repeat protein